MQCLSLRQPWASLVILGAKQFETRSWRRKEPIPQLMIHASSWHNDLYLWWEKPYYRSALTEAGFTCWRELPLGCFLGLVSVVSYHHTHEIEANLSPREIAFGNFAPGRWAWLLGSPKPLQSPIVARGHQGIFHADNELFSELLPTPRHEG